MEVLLVVLILDNCLFFICYSNHKRNETAIDTFCKLKRIIVDTGGHLGCCAYMYNSLALLIVKDRGDIYFL